MSNTWENEYAVLEEAAAKHAEIMMTLRNAHPLQWIDTAYVMKRKIPQKNLYEHESVLRQRRRVQWEVATRIARVDRELNQPPGQRFWHRREQQRQQQIVLESQEQRIRIQKQRKETEEMEKAAKERHKKALRIIQDEQRALEDAKQAVLLKKATSEKVKIDELEEKITPLKPTRAKIRQPIKMSLPRKAIDSEKENTRINVNHESIEVSFDNAVGSQQKSVQQGLEAESQQESYPPSQQKSVQQDLEAESQQESYPPSQQKSVQQDLEEESQQESYPPSNTALTSSHPYVFNDVSPPMVQRLPSVSSTKPMIEVPSSLGRQVLSEYRTMPSTPSFGAPVVVGKKLNSIVLRRLFSDLDTDHDGLLNRIEMCMALHRLHISVPAPRIAAFFNRIHVLDETIESESSRRESKTLLPVPLNQGINFKEFVAFVTAAFDQQETKQKETERKRRTPVLKLPPLQDRRDSKATSLLTEQPRKSQINEPSDVVYVEGNGGQGDQYEKPCLVLALEETDDSTTSRVFTQLPDYILSNLLEESTTKQIVRQSVENLVMSSQSSSSSDTSIVVQEIAHQVMTDVIKEFRHLLVRPNEEEIDVSGLSGASKCLEQCEQESMGRSPNETVLINEEPVSQASTTLTNEQITSVVHEVWEKNIGEYQDMIEQFNQHNEEQKGKPSSISDTMIEENRESAHEINPIDADSLEPVAQRILLVAEKAIQTASLEWPPPAPPISQTIINTENTPVEPLVMENTEPKGRTALGQLILQTIGSEGILLQPTSVLHDMKRKRRQKQQRPLSVRSSKSSSCSSSSNASTTKPELPVSTPTLEEILQQPQEPSNEVRAQEVEEFQSEITNSEPVLTKTFHIPSSLRVDEMKSQLHQSTSVISSSIESSTFNPSSSSSLEQRDSWPFFGLVTERASRRRQRRRNYRRVTSSTTGNQSSQDDLSEGEVRKYDQNSHLSDGEIYGPTKRVWMKTQRTRDMTTLAHEEDTKVQSSIESGEMLAMATIHRNFQGQIIASSISSLESGEMEDGAIPP